MTHADPVLSGIATSGWSQAQRIALVMVLEQTAWELEHFVPHPWNRLAKARAAVRELEKAGHLVRDGARILIIESSFARPQPEKPPSQLALPSEPGLGTALADVTRVPPGPVRDGTPRPSQDGRPVLSWTGRAQSPTGPPGFAPSGPGQDGKPPPLRALSAISDKALSVGDTQSHGERGLRSRAGERWEWLRDEVRALLGDAAWGRDGGKWVNRIFGSRQKNIRPRPNIVERTWGEVKRKHVERVPVANSLAAMMEDEWQRQLEIAHRRESIPTP